MTNVGSEALHPWDGTVKAWSDGRDGEGGEGKME